MLVGGVCHSLVISLPEYALTFKPSIFMEFSPTIFSMASDLVLISFERESTMSELDGETAHSPLRITFLDAGGLHGVAGYEGNSSSESIRDN